MSRKENGKFFIKVGAEKRFRNCLRVLPHVLFCLPREYIRMCEYYQGGRGDPVAGAEYVTQHEAEIYPVISTLNYYWGGVCVAE